MVRTAGLWQGSATIDYAQNVTSFSTSGYLDGGETTIRYWNICTNTNTIETTNNATISNAGAEIIKNSLYIVEGVGPDGRPYILDPVGRMTSSAIYLSTYNNWGDDCEPSTPPWDYDWSTEIEDIFRFPGGTSGRLEPNDATGRSFSRNYVTTINDLGPDKVPVDVTWQVTVIKTE
jgi:hypothetical protein